MTIVAATTVADATHVEMIAVDQAVDHAVIHPATTVADATHVVTHVAIVVVTVANTSHFHNGVYGLKVA